MKLKKYRVMVAGKEVEAFAPSKEDAKNICEYVERGCMAKLKKAKDQSEAKPSIPA